MFPSTSQMATIFLCFFYATTFSSCIGKGSSCVSCNEKDQNELLVFKQSIKDPMKSLSSWSIEQDCCKWVGIQCDNTTGRVSKLDLHMQNLEGEINFFVLEKLEFLTFLDLSSNNFKTILFPLVHSSSKNFSNLLHLDLSMNYNLHLENLRWVSYLASLKYLNLSGIFLKNETLWVQYVTMLPSLLELRLSGCSLNGENPSLGSVNFTSLSLLDISNNSFHSEIPKWLFSVNLSNSISYVDLSSNGLEGQIPEKISNFQLLSSLILRDNHLKGLIPEWMRQFKHLKQLDLSNNLFSGPVPASFGNLLHLTFLDVSFNHLNGSFPCEIGKLSKLEVLSIGFNSFSGTLSEKCLKNLSNLKSLSLDSSDFIFDLSSNWKPSFQLEKISISYSKLGPEFPSWIYTQRSLSYLDLSSSGLSFKIHDNFWNFVQQIDHLFLSNKLISGDISTSLINHSEIDLKWNRLSGKLPNLSPKVIFFDISNNSFSGPIFPFLCQRIKEEEPQLEVLDMSHNLLSGELPNCWMNWKNLLHVNLGSNDLNGKIPDSIGSLTKVQTLRVRNNNLSGIIPASLKGCKSLWYLDLGLNYFTGKIPTWFSNLSMAILLGSNKFRGEIPSQLCELSILLVLDLANNKLSGPIPKCLHKITTMVTNSIDEGLFMSYFQKWFLAPVSVRSNLEDLPLFMKGQELDYWHALKFLHSVDLSNNNLSGSIPHELFNLIALQSLNLSCNNLIGQVPIGIGKMKFLESLDLSRNKLSGEIPQSLSNLSFLSFLNLSYNHFCGEIPLGTQLQSFDEFSYIGNENLCGDPLPKKCKKEGELKRLSSMEEKDDFVTWFEMGMGIGFASAFWGVLGVIFFVRKWRHAYFRILDKLFIKINRLL